MAAAFGGNVIAFSWWHVNLLGVGLHSYGFTSGIYTALLVYYGLQTTVVGLGLLPRTRRMPVVSVPVPARAPAAAETPVRTGV
jgi:hypothetical protein